MGKMDLRKRSFHDQNRYGNPRASTAIKMRSQPVVRRRGMNCT